MKTNLHKLYQLDLDAAENGAWVAIRGGLEIKVARIGNAKFNEVVRRETAPYKAGLKHKAYGDEEQADIIRKATEVALSETVLLDWRGIIDEDSGEPVEYTPEYGLELLQDKSMAWFKDDVSAAAGYNETFLAEALAEAKEQAKN